jgi:hypothetical protein
LPQLTVSIDTAQTRVRQKGLFTLADYETWDENLSSPDVYKEPLSGWAMLRPRPFYGDWYTSTASPYDKLGVSDYSGLTAANWQEEDRTGIGGGKYLTLKDGGSASFGETAVTTTTWGKNRGFYVGFYAFSEGSDYLALQCGWSNTGNTAENVRVDFYTGGQALVYNDGVLIHRGSVGRSIQNELVEVLLIPWRRRELLVLTPFGEGFSVVFDDIEQGSSDPIVVPATKFYWTVPSAFPVVQCAPLKFATSGYVLGLPSQFKRPPVSGATPVLWDDWFNTPNDGTTVGAAVSLTTDGSTAFSADGTEKDCVVRIDLTGAGTSSPWLKGAGASFDPQTASTADSPTPLDEHLVSARLTVPDDPGDVSLDLELKAPGTLEQAGATGLRSIGNRPVKASIGSVAVLDGQSDHCSWEDAWQDAVRTYKMPVRDKWKSLERTILDDPLPLDGMYLHEALEHLLGYVGFSDTDVESTSYRLPRFGAEWNLLLRAGDSVADAVRQIMETYAATWFYGFKPTGGGIRFFAKSPDLLGVDPKCVLFATADQAYSYLTGTLGQSADLAAENVPYFVYSRFAEDILEPEANEVYVTGWDVSGGRPIVRYSRDEDSIEPATPVASRPSNWQGEVLTVGYYDGSLTSVEDVEEVLDAYAPRVTRTRRVVGWDCRMLTYSDGGSIVPLWRGDVVRLVDSDGLQTDYRVGSFEASFDFEGTQARLGSYTAEEL